MVTFEGPIELEDIDNLSSRKDDIRSESIAGMIIDAILENKRRDEGRCASRNLARGAAPSVAGTAVLEGYESLVEIPRGRR